MAAAGRVAAALCQSGLVEYVALRAEEHIEMKYGAAEARRRYEEVLADDDLLIAADTDEILSRQALNQVRSRSLPRHRTAHPAPHFNPRSSAAAQVVPADAGSEEGTRRAVDADGRLRPRPCNRLPCGQPAVHVCDADHLVMGLSTGPR